MKKSYLPVLFALILCSALSATAEKIPARSLTSLLLIAQPAEGTQHQDSPLVSGAVINLPDSAGDNAPARRSARNRLDVLQKLIDTFRLDPAGIRQYSQTQALEGKENQLEFRADDFGLVITLHLKDTSEGLRFDARATLKGEELGTSSGLSIGSGNRFVMGFTDGRTAPYIFLVLWPNELDSADIPRFSKDQGLFTEPQLLQRTNPGYPEEVREAGISGVVVLETTIDSEGHVRDVLPLKSPDERLTRSAIEAVRDWKFAPAKDAEGKPVKVRYILAVAYRLK